jgi:hypothetical protein
MHSQRIGRDHEDKVEVFLRNSGMDYYRDKLITSIFGSPLRLDFWLPPTSSRGTVILECKTFGVTAKSKADSRRRKIQEALWLLIQVRRYCAETKDARIILITGVNAFLHEQKRLLEDEIGPNFYILSIDENERLLSLLQ